MNYYRKPKPYNHRAEIAYGLRLAKWRRQDRATEQAYKTILKVWIGICFMAVFILA